MSLLFFIRQFNLCSFEKTALKFQRRFWFYLPVQLLFIRKSCSQVPTLLLVLFAIPTTIRSKKLLPSFNATFDFIRCSNHHSFIKTAPKFQCRFCFYLPVQPPFIRIKYLLIISELLFYLRIVCFYWHPTLSVADSSGA